MNIDFENLTKIPEMIELLKEINLKLNDQVQSNWLSVTQLTKYIDYSKSTIYKKIDSNEFVQNVHYYRQDKKLMFDKGEIDNWIRGTYTANNSAYASNESIIDDLLSIA